MQVIVQAVLEAIEGGEVLTTWLDKKPNLVAGSIVSLKTYKDPTKKWRVARIYDMEHSVHDFDFHYRWDNNDYSKHEGLKI